MALHTDLPIHKVTYDLCAHAARITKNMPRDFKQSLGGKIRDECVELVVMIFRANTAADKAPHLLSLLERLQVVELMLRLSRDLQCKRILGTQLERRIAEPWWRDLALQILFHDPREGAEFQSTPAQMALVPPHKRLLGQPAHLGLPIGNLSSQFFANVYLDVLDQHVKHQLRARHYIRYVDDMVLVDASAQALNGWHDSIGELLGRELCLELNASKTVLQPVARGVDFAGHVIAPHRRTIRRRTFNDALSRPAEAGHSQPHRPQLPGAPGAPARARGRPAVHEVVPEES